MQRSACVSHATHFASFVFSWSFILVSLLVPTIARAQTAVPPSAGDGLTTATAYQITELGNLVWLGQNYANGAHYALMNDIDASDTVNWNDAGTGTEVLEGFLPIGTVVSPFQGIFAGNGHKIVGLTVNRGDPSGGRRPGGLFWVIGSGGVVWDLLLEGGAIAGTEDVGALAGVNEGTILGCRASVPVTGVDELLPLPQPTIIPANAGGLVGRNSGGTIRESCATGAVRGGHGGGLVGYNNSGKIIDSYASGSVMCTYAGGLVCVNASELVLVGSITNCYATGSVVGSSGSGGFAVESSDGSIVSSYWDTESSNLSTSGGGTSETTALMKQQSTFVGWDFANVWDIAPGVNQGYPTLRSAGQPIDWPSKPVVPRPVEGATSQTLAVTLRWQDGGGATNYDVYFGMANPPVTRAATAQAATSYTVPVLLSRSTTYFWRIDARNAGGTTTGDVWHFTTAPPILPSKPAAPSPVDGATSQALALTLRWQDGGGATSYVVYFGTEKPPVTRLANDEAATSFPLPAQLDHGTTYFWRIDATNAGGTTTGDVWHFTTAPLPPRPSRPGPPVWTLWSR